MKDQKAKLHFSSKLDLEGVFIMGIALSFLHMCQPCSEHWAWLVGEMDVLEFTTLLWSLKGAQKHPEAWIGKKIA